MESSRATYTIFFAALIAVSYMIIVKEIPSDFGMEGSYHLPTGISLSRTER